MNGHDLSATLVSAIEEWEMFLSSDDVSNPCPLLLSGIHTSGVVGAGVQDDHGAWGEGFEVSQHAFYVEGVGLGVIVSIFVDILKASILEDETMIAPCWVAVVGIVEASYSVEKLSSNPQSSSAAESLDTDGSVLLYCDAVIT